MDTKEYTFKISKVDMDNLLEILANHSDYNRGRSIINIENPYKYFC